MSDFSALLTERVAEALHANRYQGRKVPWKPASWDAQEQHIKDRYLGDAAAVVAALGIELAGYDTMRGLREYPILDGEQPVFTLAFLSGSLPAEDCRE